MYITEKQREWIKKHAPKGYATTIAQELGVSESTIYNVLNGVSRNPEVRNALFDQANKEIARFNRVLTKYKQTSKEAA